MVSLFGFAARGLMRCAVVSASFMLIGCAEKRAQSSCGLNCNTSNDAGTQTLSLAWPVEGIEGQDWVVKNYVDLNQAEGPIEDYAGGLNENAKTYDNHRGIDIDIDNFRTMEQGVNVLAAASGTVIKVVDIHDDHSTEWTDNCGDFTNIIEIVLENGVLNKYAHIRTGSALVEPGDRVATGDVLAQVGSAGCSTWPHLHFELLDNQGAVRDPFLEGWWESAPVYNTPISIMDVIVKAGTISSINELLFAEANATTLAPSSALGFGLLVAGGRTGDEIIALLKDPEGSTTSSMELVFEDSRRYTKWYWNRTLTSVLGHWMINIMVNSEPWHSVNLEVR